MKMFNRVLELIALVDMNYEHIEQLETLKHILNNYVNESANQFPSDYKLTAEQASHLTIIAETTRGSHYKNALLTHPNHVDMVMQANGVKPMKNFKKELYNSKHISND